MKSSPVPAILMFVGVLLLGFGNISKSWMTLGEKGVSIAGGLRSAEICSKGESSESEGDGCQSFSYTENMGHTRGRHTLATIAGLATTGAGSLAAIFLIIAAAMSFSRPNKALAIVAVCLVGVAAISAVGFMGLMEKPREASWGVGMFAFMAGVAAALTGTIMLLLQRAPGAAPVGAMPGMPVHGMHPGMHPGMQPPMPPGMQCQTCGGMTAFVPQYQRYFCTRCQRYL